MTGLFIAARPDSAAYHTRLRETPRSKARIFSPEWSRDMLHDHLRAELFAACDVGLPEAEIDRRGERWLEFICKPRGQR